MTRVMLRIEDRTDWWHRAGCLGTDPESFFPIGDNPDASESKAVCRRCPVKDDCLSWAMATGQDHGVWGGMTPAERRAYRRAPELVRAHMRGVR